MERLKVPPNDKELEENILGYIISYNNFRSELIEVLKPEFFYYEKHKLVFKAIIYESKENKNVDCISIIQRLRKNGDYEKVGGAYIVTSLMHNAPLWTTYPINQISCLLELYTRRTTILSIQESLIKLYDPTEDVIPVVENLSKINNSIDLGSSDSLIHIKELVTDRILQYESDTINNITGITGIKSYISCLDNANSGWQKGELIIIAARPAMGKTAFALTIARNASVLDNAKVAVFSLEMPSKQLVDRMIACESQISMDKIKKRNLNQYDYQNIHSSISNLSNASIYLDDSTNYLHDLALKCRKIKKKQGLDMIVVDYLQLLKVKIEGKRSGITRDQEIGEISGGLKRLAKELDICVISLSQINRGVEQRNDKRPMMSDLRESGSIEQDADMVMFLYRPDYYGMEYDEQGNDIRGVTELIIGKFRSGETQTLMLRFNKENMTFKDALEQEFPKPSISVLHPNLNFGNDHDF